MYCRPGSIPAATDGMTAKHLARLNARTHRPMAADPGPEIRDMLLGRLSLVGVQPDIRMHHASRETILSILGDGLGLSIVCEGGTGARW